jgi:hypothetical protein
MSASLEQRILGAAEPYLGSRAATVLGAISENFLKRPLAELGIEQLSSLGYWARVVVGTSDIDIRGSVEDFERSIRAIATPTQFSAILRDRG